MELYAFKFLFLLIARLENQSTMDSLNLKTQRYERLPPGVLSDVYLLKDIFPFHEHCCKIHAGNWNLQVAKVVADELNGYLLFEHNLQLQLIPPERVHPKL